jgi:pimeloyl-ACP methyl ester carboxylesterase
MPIDTVIFVPGICGSVLKEGERTIWPGTPLSTVFESYPDEFVDVLSTSDTIIATDVLRSVPLKVLGLTIHHFDGYGNALNALRQMGYSEPGGTLIPFAYDWRRDVRACAQALRDRLSQADLPGRRIGIVAHSMGGLVARYCLEKLGAPDNVRIELLALLATPHLGAPAALQNVLGLRPEIFLSAAQCREALKNPKFPSAYQLLPRPGVPALLAQSAQTGFSVVDAFDDPAVAAQFGLVSGSLKAAQELAAELPFMAPSFRPPCRYVAVVGNEQSTIVANYRVGRSASAQEEEASGDGTVPLWSAAPPGIPVRYVAAAHMEVCTDSDTVAMLRAVLRPDLPGGRLFKAGPGVASFSVQPLKTSVRPGETFTVAVVADRPAPSIDAQVIVQRVFDNDRKDVQTVPIHYQGGPVRSLPLEFTAPEQRAALVFTLRDGAGTQQGKQASVLVVT